MRIDDYTDPHFAADVAPEYRLKIACWLFKQGVDTQQDEAKARQSWHIAATEFEQLVDSGYSHPDLFLNMGNAHVLAGELPEAILAYQRGLRLEPLNGQLSENLYAARDLVAYPENDWRHRPPDDDWPPWLPRPTQTSLLRAAFILYSLTWLAFGIWLVCRRRLAIIAAVLLFLASVVPVAFWGYFDYRTAQADEHRLIVVAVNGVTLRSGNGPLYAQHPRLATVNRGMEARLLGERGGWVQVQFPAGDIGWLPGTAVIK
jgi:hypothetical protein